MAPGKVRGPPLKKEKMSILEKGKYAYQIDGERVFISFIWHIIARVKRRRSGRIRNEHFEVSAGSRSQAHYAAGKHFKGATVLEITSCVPVGFWPHCFYTCRPGYPEIEKSILDTFELPEDL